MKELLRTRVLREQQEQLESNLHENIAVRKEGKTDHGRYKHSPQKRRNGSMLVDCSGPVSLTLKRRKAFKSLLNSSAGGYLTN
jgi:hypothetical protein